jgi:hypothetical protein
MPPPPAPAPAPPKRALPVDFVAVVDDSGSINPAEQSLLRETTMLLADLAEVGDRVCTIAFGEGARKVAATTIATDEDRRTFKEAVRTSLRFRENWSDIRAGLKLLADAANPCFRAEGQSRRVAVVLSDGRLEPRAREPRARDEQAKAALAEMAALLGGPLAGTDLYAVVLGTASSRQPIPGLAEPPSGLVLMRTVLARSDDRFFHAERLDQLLDVAMSIVGRAKGAGALAEAGTARVRIDDTVTLLTLVVRKRGTDGTRLARSSDIRVLVPGSEQPLTATARESGVAVYWSGDYEYFDLIQVRRPRPGMWEVTLANGNAPQVLFHVRSPISLRHTGRSCYFSNESDQLTAFLFDSDSGTVSRDPAGERYLMSATRLGGSETSRPLPLAYDAASGQYVLHLPEQLGRSKTQATLELVAEKRKALGASESDHLFVRRSAPFTVKVVEPIVSERVLPPLLTTVPLPGIASLVVAWSPSLTWLPRRVGVRPALAAAPTGATECAPTFEVPPTVEVEVDALAGAQWRQVHRASAVLAGSVEFPLALPGVGSYRYRYRLTGTTTEGPFAIATPWYDFSIRRGWEYLFLLAACLLGMAQWLSRATARVSGRIAGAAISPVNFSERRFQAAQHPKLKELLARHQVAFRLEPRRWLWLHQRVCLVVTQGQLTVSGPHRNQTTQLAAVGGKPARIRLPSGAAVTVTLGTDQLRIVASL